MITIVVSDMMSSIILMVSVLMGIYYASRSVEVISTEERIKIKLLSFFAYMIGSAVMLCIGLITLLISAEIYGIGVI